MRTISLRSAQNENIATTKRGKPKYAGGLVLEPKKGLYDTFILLLDFNSLYPSIIQEFNLCHTTLPEWSMAAEAMDREDEESGGGGVGGVSKADGDDAPAATSDPTKTPPKADGRSGMPDLPDESVPEGVLPKVIKSIVGRRSLVKQMIKKEKNETLKAELDLKQKALKLTANSMYGCLGFAHSRFYAQPIAALITAMGRETLQRTVEIAETTVGLEVIYGGEQSGALRACTCP